METKTKSNIVRGANIILRPWLDTEALYRLARDPTRPICVLRL